jgi:hypothetical protein
MNARSMAIVFALALFVPSLAGAGYKQAGTVTIDYSQRIASGSLGGTRNSTNAYEYLDCGVYQDLGYPATATCHAQDAAGNRVWCTTTNSGLVDQVKSIKGDSHVSFGWNTTNGCTSIGVSNGSQHAPKQP